MYSTVAMEAVFFLSSIVAGLCAAFLYDLLRISRRILGPSDAVVNVQDVIFLATAALILFYAAYLKNSGEVRWQGFIGCGLGAVLYAVIVKNRVLNASTFVIKWIVRIIQRIIKILFFPVSLMMKILKKPVHIVMWYTGQKVRRARQLAKRGGDKVNIRLKNMVLMLRKK